MAINQSSRFECPDCGIDMLTTFVSYDPLGYAVCPFCESDTKRGVDGNQPESTNSDRKRVSDLTQTGASDPDSASEWQWGTDRPTDPV